ncbi:MAG: hypothetical protein WA799_08275 [Nitrosotalea sp.]
MKTLASDKSKPMGMLFGVLALIVVATISPHAFAVTYTDVNNPHGPFQGIAWGVGLGIAGLVAGVGILTTRMRHH